MEDGRREQVEPGYFLVHPRNTVHGVRNTGGGTSCVYGLKLDQMSDQHRDILQGLIARQTRAQESGEGETATAVADN